MQIMTTVDDNGCRTWTGVHTYHDVVAAVDEGRGGGAVGAAQSAGPVGEPRDGVGEAHG